MDEKIITQMNQIHPMLARVTRQVRGLPEHELRKYIKALIYTRVRHHLPYVTLTKTQTDKHETLLRKCTGLALGVSRSQGPNHLVGQTGLFDSLVNRVTLHH